MRIYPRNMLVFLTTFQEIDQRFVVKLTMRSGRERIGARSAELRSGSKE